MPDILLQCQRLWFNSCLDLQEPQKPGPVCLAPPNFTNPPSSFFPEFWISQTFSWISQHISSHFNTVFIGPPCDKVMLPLTVVPWATAPGLLWHKMMNLRLECIRKKRGRAWKCFSPKTEVKRMLLVFPATLWSKTSIAGWESEGSPGDQKFHPAVALLLWLLTLAGWHHDAHEQQHGKVLRSQRDNTVPTTHYTYQAVCGGRRQKSAGCFFHSCDLLTSY